MLLATPIAIDHVNRLAWTALQKPSSGDGGTAHTEIVRLFVGAGANVNLADAQGVTPLARLRAKAIAAILEARRARGGNAGRLRVLQCACHEHAVRIPGVAFERRAQWVKPKRFVERTRRRERGSAPVSRLNHA